MLRFAQHDTAIGRLLDRAGEHGNSPVEFPPRYLERGGCAFYPWLRQIAWERLAKLHRCHLDAQCRSVNREAYRATSLPDESTMLLAERLAASGTSVGGRLVREELRQRIHQVLKLLSPHHREVVVLRHLEQLSFNEVAEVLRITQAAARSRYGQAIERLDELLSDSSEALR